MNKSDISKLIEQAATLKQESEVSLVTVDPSLVPGRTTLRNQALQAYQETFAVLRAAIGNHAGGIFVVGPGAAAFAALAEEEGPAITLDASRMYREVAEAWFSTVRVDKVFALDCLISFLNGLGSLLPPLGVARVPPPDFGKYFGRKVESLQDAVDLSREIIRETVGDDLNGLYINHRLAEQAVLTGWDLAVIPVVLINTTLDEVKSKDGLFSGLFYGRNVGVAAKADVTKEDVLAAFKSLRAKMSPKQTKPQVCGISFAEGAPGCPQVLVNGRCSAHPNARYIDTSENSQ